MDMIVIASEANVIARRVLFPSKQSPVRRGDHFAPLGMTESGFSCNNDYV